MPMNLNQQQIKKWEPLTYGQRKALSVLAIGRWVWLSADQDIAECFNDDNSNILRFRLEHDGTATQIS